jgi:hypothetical protein
MEQIQQVQAETTSADAEHTEQMAVRFTSGESYGVAVRGHRIQVDQPADAGGQDSAPTRLCCVGRLQDRGKLDQ